MIDHQTRDELARLRAELAAQRATTSALHARLARIEHPGRRHPRRFLPLALVALLVALVPLATLAAGPFNDLTGGVHDPNIQAIYDAGITRGCVPNVSYCPTANVTREEMASFLARTAGLGTNPPVANAKTAVSAQTAANAGHANNADTATSASNATTVGGFTPAQFSRASAGGQGGSGVPLNGGFQNVATATITAPRAGFVVVSASAMGYNAATSGCPCEIGLGLYDVTAATPGGSYFFESTLGNSSPTADAFAALSNQWVFPVAAGPHAFAARMVQNSGTASVLGYAALTLTFTPYADAPAGGFEADTGQRHP